MNNEKLVPQTAKYCLSEMLNYYEYFPFDTGAVQPISVVLETDDHSLDPDSSTSGELLECENVQFLLLNREFVITVTLICWGGEFRGFFVEKTGFAPPSYLGGGCYGPILGYLFWGLRKNLVYGGTLLCWGI